MTGEPLDLDAIEEQMKRSGKWSMSAEVLVAHTRALAASIQRVRDLRGFVCAIQRVDDGEWIDVVKWDRVTAALDSVAGESPVPEATRCPICRKSFAECAIDGECQRTNFSLIEHRRSRAAPVPEAPEAESFDAVVADDANWIDPGPVPGGADGWLPIFR